MATAPSQSASDIIYTGPLNNDPLTDNELAILLAIPRGAEKTPNATVFRLPLGPDPAQGWVDVTYSEARSIIARLAVDWKSKLSNEVEGLSVGPGTTICLLVQPAAHLLFHWLAFWALGCTIQFVSSIIGDEAIAVYLNKSGCQVVIHSGMSDDRVERIRSGCNAATIRLPEGECAHQLALSNKEDRTSPTLPWPEPRRPNPAIILHSSGSTGAAKLLRFSLYFYTLGLSGVQKLKQATPDLRPFLMFCPPYWQTFTITFLTRLVAGIPMTLAHVLDFVNFPPSDFIDWARGLGVGGVACSPRFVRDTLTSGSELNINFLQGLYNIRILGSAIGETTSALAEKYELNLTNILGSTELGGILLTSKPPYTHLRQFPGTSPLVLPLSDTDSDGSRQVQFWFLPSTSRQVAHLHVTGGVPLKLEPFPGDGPHNGELALRWDDIFKEIPGPVDNGSETLYLPIGRSDDFIKLAGARIIFASVYESELTSTITSYLASQADHPSQWVVDGVQLFGSNRPCTALVVQLRASNRGEPTGEIGEDMLAQIAKQVELVNAKLELRPHVRVNPQKRMLVVTSEEDAYGPGVSDGGRGMPRLTMTHKHTLQRWKNVVGFGSWLDGLDYSDP